MGAHSAHAMSPSGVEITKGCLHAACAVSWGGSFIAAHLISTTCLAAPTKDTAHSQETVQCTLFERTYFKHSGASRAAARCRQHAIMDGRCGALAAVGWVNICRRSKLRKDTVSAALCALCHMAVASGPLCLMSLLCRSIIRLSSSGSPLSPRAARMPHILGPPWCQAVESTYTPSRSARTTCLRPLRRL